MFPNKHQTSANQAIDHDQCQAATMNGPKGSWLLHRTRWRQRRRMTPVCVFCVCVWFSWSRLENICTYRRNNNRIEIEYVWNVKLFQNDIYMQFWCILYHIINMCNLKVCCTLQRCTTCLVVVLDWSASKLLISPSLGGLQSSNKKHGPLDHHLLRWFSQQSSIYRFYRWLVISPIPTQMFRGFSQL